MLATHSHQSVVWRQLDLARHFMLFLFVVIPKRILLGWRESAVAIEAQIAVVATLQNLGQPLFQDYTREGRLIGLLLRLFRILAGTLVQVVVAVVFVAALILWCVIPFFLLVQIVRNAISFLL